MVSTHDVRNALRAYVMRMEEITQEVAKTRTQQWLHTDQGGQFYKLIERCAKELLEIKFQYNTWKGKYERVWGWKQLYVSQETELIRGDIVIWMSEARKLMPDELYETDEFRPLWDLVCSFHKETDETDEEHRELKQSEQATLKQMMEILLQKVNDAHTRVPWNSYSLSAYGLFSSWPNNATFIYVYNFCLKANHTSEELFQKYREALQIIIEMYNQAVRNYRIGVSRESIAGDDKDSAKEVLSDIAKLLKQAKAKYEAMSREQCIKVIINILPYIQPEFEVQETTTISALKQSIADMLKIPKNFVLKFKGQTLIDEMTLGDYNIPNEGVLDFEDLSAWLHPNVLKPDQTTRKMHLRHLLNRMQYCIDI